MPASLPAWISGWLPVVFIWNRDWFITSKLSQILSLSHCPIDFLFLFHFLIFRVRVYSVVLEPALEVALVDQAGLEQRSCLCLASALSAGIKDTCHGLKLIFSRQVWFLDALDLVRFPYTRQVKFSEPSQSLDSLSTSAPNAHLPASEGSVTRVENLISPPGEKASAL